MMASNPMRGRGGGGKGGGGGGAVKEAPNTLRSRSVARVVDLICEGEIVGLVAGPQSIYFDDTPLQNKDGTYNFEGVKYETRPGQTDQDYIPGYQQVETEVAVGILVEKATPVVREISDADNTSIRVTINTPALVATADGTGQLIPTSVDFVIEVKPSDGPYKGIRATQTWASFTGSVSPTSTAIEITISGETQGPDRDEDVDFAVYYRAVGASDWILLGSEAWHVSKRRVHDEDGWTLAQETYSRTFSVDGLAETTYEYRVSGSPTPTVTARSLVYGYITLSGKTTSTYSASYYSKLEGAAPWLVRVTRISDDSDSVNLNNDIYFSSITEIVDVKLQYPDSALIAMEVDAQHFGGRVPRRAYDIKGRIIQVPDNYWPEDPRITNLMIYSNDLTYTGAGQWSLTSATISRSTDTASPSGYRNTVTSTSAVVDPIVTQTATFEPGTSTLTATVWVKAGTLPGNIRVAVDDGSGNGFYVDYNFTTGLISASGATGSGAAVGDTELLALDDGVRVSVNGTIPSSATSVRLRVTGSDNDAIGRTFQLNGAVVAVSEYARSFIETGDERELGGTFGEDRHYEGIWGGTFHESWSNNPAWVLYDLITNERLGLGRFIADDQVDKWALYEIAQYCDELIPNGFGGTEPRFTFNGSIATREEAYQVIQAVSANFRGMTYWGSGTLTAVQDAPTDPVKLVTPANVLDGMFNYQGTGLRTLYAAAYVTWTDPADQYHTSVEVVEDDSVIEDYGYNRTTDIVAYACTSKGQAFRAGRWLLDTNKNEDQVVSYTAGFDHSDLRPGHIIAIADPFYAGLRLGGRTVSGTTTSITLDDAIEIESGKTYEVSMTMEDGTIADRTITNSPGTTDTLTWSSALTDAPVANSVWVVTVSDLSPRLFRVTTIIEKDKHIYEISAMLHDPTKFSRVDEFADLSPLDYSALPTGPLGKPSNIQYEAYLYSAGPSAKSAITFSWDGPTPPEPRINGFECEIMGPNDVVYMPFETTQTTSVTAYDVEDGTYSFRVRSRDGFGGRSQWTEATDISVTTMTEIPANVANFRAVVSGGTATLYWDALDDLRQLYYRIKSSPVTSGATWGTSIDLMPVVDTTMVQVNAITGSFLIKAYTRDGLESADATIIASQVTALDGYNAELFLDQAPTFTGTKSNMVVSVSKLVLDSEVDRTNISVLDDVPLSYIDPDVVVGLGTYLISGTATDLGQVYTSRVSFAIAAEGSDTANVMSSWSTLSSVSTLAGADPATWGVVVLYRVTEDDPAGSPTYTAWAPFVIGDYSGRAFEFRVVVYTLAANIEPRISSLSVTIDMPDRVDGGDDIDSTASGITITYSPAFKSNPAVGIVAQGLATGDYYEVTSKSRTGFTIIFKNAAGTGVARTFDYVAKGWGYER
jgi:predicted phage tail protein